MILASTAPDVMGLRHHEQKLLGELWREWAARFPRNRLRRQYLDSKQETRHLGIAVPPILEDLEVAIGLPELAVEGMAARINWDGIVSPSNSEDPFELSELLDDNRFDIEFPQAVRSSLGQSVAFISTTLGDVASGEPKVKQMPHSALWSAGLWDRVRRGLRGFISIDNVDDLGRPTSFTMISPEAITHCRTAGAGWFVEATGRNPLGYVTVEALPHAPTLDEPLGAARVNRRVMNLTDRAVRAILRLEVHSELFSAPRFLLMGADESTFMDPNTGKPIPLWNWYMTRMNAIPTDEEGELPTIEQIAQQSPTPHIESLRTIYSQFSGETKVPLNSLGIVQDNPPSAEGLYAMKEDLVILCSNFIRVATGTLNRSQQTAILLRDGRTELTPEMRQISQRFRNPAIPSVVSQSDAIVKQVSAIPELALSDVILEELGYTEEQITRIRADIKRNQGSRLAREVIDAAKARGVTGANISG